MLVRVMGRPQAGRWRCGKHWPHEWVEAEVTDAQLKTLQEDPQLVVHLAERRNASLPTVNSVQPGARKKPEPQPWADPKLEKLRQQAIRLDRQADEAEAEEQRQEAAAQAVERENAGEPSRGVPVDSLVQRAQHGNGKHKHNR